VQTSAIFGDSLLNRLIADIADALKAADSDRVAHKAFQPGIGPFGESEMVRAGLVKLRSLRPCQYEKAVIKRTPDLLVPGRWAIEFKIVRPFGDNGKAAEHWSENVLHPYAGNISSLGDCLKLLRSDIGERKVIVVVGYEHSPSQIPVEPAISAFEIVARNVLRLDLSCRCEELRTGLVHPIHQQLRVFGYEILGSLPD